VLDIRRFILDEQGVTVVEYGLTMVIMVAALVGGFAVLVPALESWFATPNQVFTP